MAYWLFKSEPGNWSWEQHKAVGDKGAPPKRSRNHLANKHLKEMQPGDMGFFYHSVSEKRIVGVVRVVNAYRADETDDTGKFGVVDVAAVSDMPGPVSLADIKANPELSDMVLVNNSRLSVQPVTPEEWRIICRMGGFDAVPQAAE